MCEPMKPAPPVTRAFIVGFLFLLCIRRARARLVYAFEKCRKFLPFACLEFEFPALWRRHRSPPRPAGFATHLCHRFGACALPVHKCRSRATPDPETDQIRGSQNALPRESLPVPAVFPSTIVRCRKGHRV